MGVQKTRGVNLLYVTRRDAGCDGACGGGPGAPNTGGKARSMHIEVFRSTALRHPPPTPHSVVVAWEAGGTWGVQGRRSNKGHGELGPYITSR